MSETIDQMAVRPELVEGCSFFFLSGVKWEVQGFDKLSPNGSGLWA
jgi:hypothetical protein